MNDQSLTTTVHAVQLPSQAQLESAAIISLIDRLASDPTIDIDRLMKALEMRERVIGRNAKLAFEQAFAAAQAEIEPVAKNATNDQTKSRYAKLEAINEAVMPIITRHGFSVSFDTACPIEGHYRMPRTSSMSVAQCSELIEMLYAKGAEWEIQWSEPELWQHNDRREA